MQKPEKNQQYVRNSDIAPLGAAEGVQRKVLAYSGEAMCVENYFEAGAVGAVHSHPHTQITYVAQGVFEFMVGDKGYTVSKGDTLIKRDGVAHGCKCLEKGILVDFFTPMRDDFV